MDSGSHTHVAGHVFINPDTGVTASENLFRSMVPRMTGLKDVPPNAACSSSLMMILGARCTSVSARLNQPLIT